MLVVARTKKLGSYLPRYLSLHRDTTYMYLLVELKGTSLIVLVLEIYL